MTHKLIILSSAVALVSVGALGSFPRAVTPSKTAAKKAPRYSSVAGLIKTQCAMCHNAKSHPEKVDLSSYGSLMKSGEHGSIVVPGHPEKSKLIQYVDGAKQPRMPMGKPPLSTSQIDALKAWVKAGAKA